MDMCVCTEVLYLACPEQASLGCAQAAINKVTAPAQSHGMLAISEKGLRVENA